MSSREIEASLQEFGEFLLRGRLVKSTAALDAMRRRLRTRHYSCRTETTYVDWGRRFLPYLSERQGVAEPTADAGGVQDFLTHLALERGVSASSQNQALSALLFLCRDVLGVEVGRG